LEFLTTATGYNVDAVRGIYNIVWQDEGRRWGWVEILFIDSLL
jgi:hypothetical protein